MRKEVRRGTHFVGAARGLAVVAPLGVPMLVVCRCNPCVLGGGLCAVSSGTHGTTHSLTLTARPHSAHRLRSPSQASPRRVAVLENDTARDGLANTRVVPAAPVPQHLLGMFTRCEEVARGRLRRWRRGWWGGRGRRRGGPSAPSGGRVGARAGDGPRAGDGARAGGSRGIEESRGWLDVGQSQGILLEPAACFCQRVCA